VQILSKAVSEVSHCLMRFAGGRMSSVSSVTFWNQNFRAVSKTEGLKAARNDSARAREGSDMIRGRYIESSGRIRYLVFGSGRNDEIKLKPALYEAWGSPTSYSHDVLVTQYKPTGDLGRLSTVYKEVV